ncbi:MAG TPA: ATP-binding protein, partial [Gemmatimonadales bacterium]|nr:ATP-binding protein [Gemmatimonadales bacterium]
MSTPGGPGPSRLDASLARGSEAEGPERLDAGVEHELRARLLRESGLALFGHPVLIALIAALAWSDAPHSVLLGWAVAVVLATVIRAIWLRLVMGRSLTDRALRQGVRLTVLLLGLAWGVGAAVVVRLMPIEDVALVLVVLAGIVAGALTTLTADPPSFYALLGSMVVPLFASLIASAHERVYLVSAAVTALFAVAMGLVYWKAHIALLEHLAVMGRLALSDATAKRERAFLDSVFQSVPDAILVVDREGRMRAANPGFATLFGYSVAEVVGQRIGEALVPPQARDAHLDLVRRVNAGETVVAEVERRRKDGQMVTVQLAAAPVVGHPGGARLLVYTDLTARKRAEEAMRQARDLAERTGRARAAFLANMSHEIRTPMNAVLGFVELILDTELTTEQRRALELVRSSSEALLTILNDILDYSKIEAEHLELESIPFDLSKLVHATSSLLAVRAREKHLELLADVPPDLPRMVRGDPTRIRQVLTNLIGNAIKFTEEGEVVVSIAGTGMEDGQARLRFGVRDTGIGIAAEQLTTIFEEFTQADASMTRRYGGTGLGLAISQKLVRLMGGELAVTSALGQGSDFYFTVALPVETVAATPGSQPAVVVGRRVLV